MERSTVSKYWACARLNLHVARLALMGRWLGKSDFAAGYDTVAPNYDDAWLRHLKPVTADLISRLPEHVQQRILDLGCGTGYSTQLLAQCYPATFITAVDLSEKMLDQARAKHPGERVEFECGDMLDFLRAQPSSSANLVFSAWAIGYSSPARLVEAASRVLNRGGTLAFVVNLEDTLGPVFSVFRRCMARFPERVARAAWLHFPKDMAALEQILVKNGFEILWREDGCREINPPEVAVGAGKLEWLRKTGVLAGFDAMLPLEGQVAEAFDALLLENPEPICHHYAAVVATLR